ncbi:hypothetical protein LMG28727_05786 [Paraburkholderia kirstenboschensis]|nr:hypothetical protein LMG28727_05786 [Paraburkholderia kirstenboschensis]
MGRGNRTSLMELLPYCWATRMTLDTRYPGCKQFIVLKAFCKLTLTPGIAQRSKAVRLAKRYVLLTASPSAIWKHQFDLDEYGDRARMEPIDHCDPDYI